ncbi:hypothetical protein MHYP_G00046100 [Metynnis hypsauchen]
MLVRRMEKRQKASEEARDGGGKGALGHKLGDFDLTRGQEDSGADVERDEKKAAALAFQTVSSGLIDLLVDSGRVKMYFEKLFLRDAPHRNVLGVRIRKIMWTICGPPRTSLRTTALNRLAAPLETHRIWQCKLEHIPSHLSPTFSKLASPCFFSIAE